MTAPGRRMATLLYHDVVEAGHSDASGFRGGAAGLYKLTTGEFDAHLAALKAAALGPPALATSGGGWMLHFDDGGASALALIAPRLEALGWRGHFFVSTRFLGANGFLDAEGVRALHRRGHQVGSHSWSHPERIAELPHAEIVEEWKRSLQDLASILGAAPTTASVPGGFYSDGVARAAAEAGIHVLFNSEPCVTHRVVSGTQVWGRFNINRRTRAANAAGLARGRADLRASQYVAWNAKKLAKRFAGPLYRRLRNRLLEGRVS